MRPRRGEHSPRRLLPSRLVLLLAGILLAEALAEVLLPRLGGMDDVANPLYSLHDSDPELGWIGRPGIRRRFRRGDFAALVEHDALGFRAADPPPPADATSSLLVLGDSFTWGWGVGQGEVVTDHLQRALAAPRVAVRNRGVNAFGTSQQLLLLRRELARGHHDEVLLLFYDNDVGDNLNGKSGRRPLFALEGEQLVSVNQPPRPLVGRIERFVKDHSSVYGLIVEAWRRLGGRGRDSRATGDDPTVEAEGAAPSGHDADADAGAGAGAGKDGLPGAALTRRLLREMRKECERHGARFTVALVPRDVDLADVRPTGRGEAVRSLLREVAADGTRVVDLTPALRGRVARGEILHFAHDEHWTPAGHAAAASALLAAGIGVQPVLSAASPATDRGP